MPSRYEGKIENIDESSWPGSKLESIDIAKKLLNQLGKDEHIIHVPKDRCFIIKKLSELDMGRYFQEDNLVSCLGLCRTREFGPDKNYESHDNNKEGNTIVDVFLHELAHMDHSLHYSSHGKEFHTRLRELKNTYYTSYNRKNISNPGRRITMNSDHPNKVELRCIRISRYNNNNNNNNNNTSNIINYLCKTRFLDWLKRFSSRYCDDIYSKHWSIHIVGLIGLGAGAFGSTKFIQLLKSRK